MDSTDEYVKRLKLSAVHREPMAPELFNHTDDLHYQAAKIHSEMDDWNDEEKAQKLMAYFGPSMIQQQLLRIEFRGFTPEPEELSDEEFVDRINELLHRYHWETGGYQMGSRHWELHQHGTGVSHYHIPEGESWWVNTVPTDGLKQTQQYLTRLNQILKNVSTQHVISMEQREYKRDATYLIIFRMVPSTSKDDDVEVGL